MASLRLTAAYQQQRPRLCSLSVATAISSVNTPQSNSILLAIVICPFTTRLAMMALRPPRRKAKAIWLILAEMRVEGWSAEMRQTALACVQPFARTEQHETGDWPGTWTVYHRANSSKDWPQCLTSNVHVHVHVHVPPSFTAQPFRKAISPRHQSYRRC